MKIRIITGFLLLCVIVPVFIFWHTVFYEIFFAFLAVMAVYELLHCTGLSKSPFFLIPCCIIAGILPFISSDESYLSQNSSIGFSGRYFYIMMLLLFYMMAVSLFSHGKYKLKDTAVAFMMILYVLFGLSGMVAIRDLQTQNGVQYGIYLVILVFIASWLTDTGAYFFGMAFGKHKLIPDISPKKTIEGAIGGTITGTAFCVLYAFILDKIPTLNLKPHYLFVLIAGFLMSILSQIGDLLASNVKRTYDVKDFGKILPGHGGVMDRVDSIVAASTMLYILCYFMTFSGMLV